MKTVVVVKIVCPGFVEPVDMYDILNLIYGIDNGSIDGSFDITGVKHLDGE